MFVIGQIKKERNIVITFHSVSSLIQFCLCVRIYIFPLCPSMWMLHLPTLNLRLNASSTSWRDHLNDHSYFEAEMTNLITKTKVKITSKEVLVRQRDNLDDTEKQVQEENKGKEAVRNHSPKTMEAGSEEDPVADSSSQENDRCTKRHLDEGPVGTDFQESEACSFGFDMSGTFRPAKCIPGSKLVKHVHQTVASSIFNLQTTMTVDGKYDPH